MGVFGKSMAITIGVLIGGGFGFYWRETSWLNISEGKKDELEEQLKRLIKLRKEKENLLIRNKTCLLK